MKLRGTVEFRDVEMGVWVLSGDDGRTYQLSGGAPALRKVGQRVEIEGEVDASAATMAMVGPVLRVRGFRSV
jgi:cob(I)alamin adenosyltransferase